MTSLTSAAVGVDRISSASTAALVLVPESVRRKRRGSPLLTHPGRRQGSLMLAVSTWRGSVCNEPEHDLVDVVAQHPR
jgi:hypothetical protein